MWPGNCYVGDGLRFRWRAERLCLLAVLLPPPAVIQCGTPHHFFSYWPRPTKLTSLRRGSSEIGSARLSLFEAAGRLNDARLKGRHLGGLSHRDAICQNPTQSILPRKT